jgi:hypothetical protein
VHTSTGERPTHRDPWPLSNHRPALILIILGKGDPRSARIPSARRSALRRAVHTQRYRNTAIWRTDPRPCSATQSRGRACEQHRRSGSNAGKLARTSRRNRPSSVQGSERRILVTEGSNTGRAPVSPSIVSLFRPWIHRPEAKKWRARSFGPGWHEPSRNRERNAGHLRRLWCNTCCITRKWDRRRGRSRSPGQHRRVSGRHGNPCGNRRCRSGVAGISPALQPGILRIATTRGKRRICSDGS